VSRKNKIYLIFKQTNFAHVGTQQLSATKHQVLFKERQNDRESEL